MTIDRNQPTDPEVIRRMRWTRRYRRWRAGILRNEPLCRSCAENGFTVAAEHIDHIEAVHLAPERFWDRANIQPLCRDCHENKHRGKPLTLEQFREREAWLRHRGRSADRPSSAAAGALHQVLDLALRLPISRASASSSSGQRPHDRFQRPPTEAPPPHMREDHAEPAEQDGASDHEG